MQFSYSIDAGAKNIELDKDLYKYLIKARRHKIGQIIPFRNLKDDFIYFYEIILIDRKKALLELKNCEKKIIENQKKLHIGWCVVDPKTVEKSIASLNEIGVDKITFIYCDYSQKNFKINFEKLEKILINSSSQCGRSSIIKLDMCESLDKFLQNNNAYILDFSDKSIDSKIDSIDCLVIGCEGGFSDNEREKFDKEKIVGFESNLILRSETAAIATASKIII